MPMTTTHYGVCTLCEAACGIALEVDGDRVTALRGDKEDPLSRGHICPKAAALADLHHDPDRLKRPMVRAGASWREIEWDEAFDRVANAIRRVQVAHGPDAVAVYQGNPTAHNLGLMTFGQLLYRRLGTRHLFSSSSVDQLPHMVAAHSMFGDGLLMPVPDIERTDYFLCFGANPLVSNGSIMTAFDIRNRLKALRARGGKIVVVDPRRTETADAADQHIFIRPGTDSLLLLSMLQVIFDERLERPGRLAAFLDGLEPLRAAAAEFPPERTVNATGIGADEVRELAREFARARGAAYGRIGVCTQEFGTLSAWLLYALNIVCGRLDTDGGMMFTTPAVDAEAAMRVAGLRSTFARWKSRVRGLPEFGGELPVAVLAEEIETSGSGQIRALVVSAGNPVLSTPNGRRLERALGRLDFMVAIDPYLNETTSQAHVILPPTSALQRSHYDLALANYAVRNFARYSPPVFERAADQRHDWEICLALWMRLGGWSRRPVGALLRRLGPDGILDVLLRFGPHRLTLQKLRAAPHGLDLGPLEPRLPQRLRTERQRIDLAPRRFLDDIPRLRASLIERSQPGGGLVLIGRRQLRSNNSWLHNSARLVKGRPRCTLLMHPGDAGARGLSEGDEAQLASRAGAIIVRVEVSDEMMPGVVSLPHGWGHARPGVRLRVASALPGASVNDVTTEELIDPVSGTASLSGVPVEVTPVDGARPQPQ